jgi:hypothetical protein
MRRKMLAVVLSATALAMSAAPAIAAIRVGPGKGNPQTNPTGKCPSGQNKDTSPGGLKKCS